MNVVVKNEEEKIHIEDIAKVPIEVRNLASLQRCACVCNRINHSTYASMIPTYNDVFLIQVEAKYQNYLVHQQKDIDSFKRDEEMLIPHDIDYMNLSKLSTEEKVKLQEARPSNLSAISRMQG